MDRINRIITEEINKAVVTKYSNRIEKLLIDLSKIDFNSYGAEIINFSQELYNFGWNVVNTIKQGNLENNNGSGVRVKSGIGSRYFNMNGLSRTLQRYGFKIPDEGITTNVVNNAVKTNRWINSKFGNNGQKQQTQKLNNNIRRLEGNLKQLMDKYWPNIFSKYANIVGRYQAVLQKFPTLTMLTQTLEELKQTLG